MEPLVHVNLNIAFTHLELMKMLRVTHPGETLVIKCEMTDSFALERRPHTYVVKKDGTRTTVNCGVQANTAPGFDPVEGK